MPPPQTPRKHKERVPDAIRFQGLTLDLPRRFSVDEISKAVKRTLKLSFDIDPWQAHFIRRVKQGYDAIVIAGTGYGKSVLFEGLAALASGPRRLVIVVSPLKALERDQADQAAAKGLKTAVLNQDTSREGKVWEDARKRAQIVYLSPEMALSDSFAKRLWKDPKFRKRLAAVIVDEAHCIDEWGGDDFRPAYRLLHQLRVFTGMEVPMVACTATARASTFSTIWDTLGFGLRPFWGIDVGIERPNLFFHVRELRHTKKPILEVLSFLPATISDQTTRDDIDKGIIYFESEAQCRSMAHELRKCLPSHLRDTVFAYSSNLSEKAKQQCWERFMKGEIRILCATDAAGMGCNVSDVKFVIIFGRPPSFAAVIQRWGRAGRDRVTLAYCLLLMPKWAFRPRMPAVVARSVKGKESTKSEPKSYAVSRAKLDPALEQFTNLVAPDCAHSFMRETLRPSTGLFTTVMSPTLDATLSTSRSGSRSQSMRFDSSWTITDLPSRTPNRARCCYICNPGIARMHKAVTPKDARLHTYAKDFLFPLIDDSSVMTDVESVLSDTSALSESQTSGGKETSKSKGTRVPQEEIDTLRDKLVAWRERRHIARGSSSLRSSQTVLSDAGISRFTARASDYLTLSHITPKALRRLVPWDTATETDLAEVTALITEWRELVAPITSPSKSTPSQRPRKVQRAEQQSPDYVDSDSESEPDFIIRPLHFPHDAASAIRRPEQAREMVTPRPPRRAEGRLGDISGEKQDLPPTPRTPRHHPPLHSSPIHNDVFLSPSMLEGDAQTSTYQQRFATAISQPSPHKRVPNTLPSTAPPTRTVPAPPPIQQSDSSVAQWSRSLHRQTPPIQASPSSSHSLLPSYHQRFMSAVNSPPPFSYPHPAREGESSQSPASRENRVTAFTPAMFPPTTYADVVASGLPLGARGYVPSTQHIYQPSPLAREAPQQGNNSSASGLPSGMPVRGGRGRRRGRGSMTVGATFDIKTPESFISH